MLVNTEVKRVMLSCCEQQLEPVENDTEVLHNIMQL